MYLAQAAPSMIAPLAPSAALPPGPTAPTAAQPRITPRSAEGTAKFQPSGEKPFPWLLFAGVLVGSAAAGLGLAYAVRAFRS